MNKNSNFDILINYSVREEIYLPAGTKIGVAKTLGLAAVMDGSKKKAHPPGGVSIKRSASFVAGETTAGITEMQVDEGSDDSESEIRDQILENKKSRENLSSPTAERDISLDLNEELDRIAEAVRLHAGPFTPNEVDSDAIMMNKNQAPKANDKTQYKGPTGDKQDNKTDSGASEHQNTILEVGKKLAEQTDFLTKHCYPHLVPLFEMYCVHCIKNGKCLEDKDVIGVADDMMPSLAAYEIDNMEVLCKGTNQ